MGGGIDRIGLANDGFGVFEVELTMTISLKRSQEVTVPTRRVKYLPWGEKRGRGGLAVAVTAVAWVDESMVEV